MTSANITVVGNLAGDSETRFTSGGRTLLTFTLAHTPQRKTDTGWEDAGDTQWYRCTLWGALADTYAPILRKGQVGPVTVVGRLKPSIFEGQQGPRLSLDVDVDAIGVREKRGAPLPSSAPAGGQAGDPWSTSTGQGFDSAPPF